MSKGGFTSLVRITRSTITGGILDGGEPITCGKMELEGRLLELHYGDFEGHIDPSIKTYVYVEIEFEESQEISWVMEDLERPYIGTLQLRDHRAKANSEIRLSAIVRITLPMSLFGKLALMEGKNIKFDTIHALIPNPTEGQKEDNIIAFVKRAYFETTANLAPEVKKRRWGFG